jgi:hypothetical protein
MPENDPYKLPIEILAACIAILLLLVASKVVRKVMRERRRTKIGADSPRLAALRSLNSQFEFHPELSRVFVRDLDSKRQYDRFDPLECLLGILIESPDEFEGWLLDAEENESLLGEYEARLQGIPRHSYQKVSWAMMEDELFEEELLRPETEPTVAIEWRYTSPAGRRRYLDEEVFSFDEVRGLLRESRKIAKGRSTRQAQIRRERALMSDSLRYDVLRRDNFTCQICGSSAKDGVRLEVDHIVPVSKGGKTEMSNLQTLCERCNRGKRDKV